MNQIYKNCGFSNDNDLKILKSISSIKSQIHIDVYIENPYMLLSRTSEKNISIKTEDDRIIIFKNDRYHTFIFNVLQSEIMECMFKKYNDSQYEFIFRVQNINYKILIII